MVTTTNKGGAFTTISERVTFKKEIKRSKFIAIAGHISNEQFAQSFLSEEVFFKDYAEANAKLSNLGAKFDPPEGFSLDGPTPEKFVAAKYSSGKRELSETMKQKIRAEYQAVGGNPDKPLQSNYFLNIIYNSQSF